VDFDASSVTEVMKSFFAMLKESAIVVPKPFNDLF